MNPKHRLASQRGYTLTEVLVAVAVTIVIFVGILLLYDRANQVFKKSTESSDMQQSVRVAYDRVLADVRMAGFDYKRGGPLVPGQTAAPWTPARQYNSGTIVTPIVPNGRTYRALGDGTSGPTEPVWPAAGGQVVETGATPPITWQENGGAVYEQPDEQIEHAGATAITIRANFDYSAKQTGDTDFGREPSLESANFPVVTTGNDEVVTYALVSNRAPSGTAPNNQSVTMYVDMNSSGAPTRTARPGGSAETLKTISGVDLTNNNPPYTLYRFTFDSTGAVQRTALADNIRSLNFFYFTDASGQVPLRDTLGNLAPSVGGGGQYSPTVAGSWNAPERQTRARIRGVRVRLVGMNPQPDTGYNDPSAETGMLASTSSTGVPVFATDTVAPTYRRVVADTMVAPRNLGLTGMPQTFLQPPPAPTIQSVCNGYCGITVVNWNPNTTNPNASYVVMWDNAPGGSFSNSFDAGTSNTFAVDLTDQNLSNNFYFKVRATNQGGSTESAVYGPVVSKNATKPNVVQSLVATGISQPALAGKVRLTWSAPVTNASGNPTCTTGSPAVTTFLREIRGFRIYRSTASNVPTNSATLQVDETTSGVNAPTTDGYGNFTWDDLNVACGQDYYYRIETVEWCEAVADYNTTNNANLALSDPHPNSPASGVGGRAGTSGTPAPPVNLATSPMSPGIPPPGLANSVCDSATNTCTVYMQWSKVTQDTAGNPINIEEYEIERTPYINGVQTGLITEQTVNFSAQTGSTITWTDTVQMYDTATFLNYTYGYRIRALQTSPCPSGNFGAQALFPPPCTFTGSIYILTGVSIGDGLTPATAWVMNAGDTIQVVPPTATTFSNTDVIISTLGGTVITTFNSTSSPALFTWANLDPGVIYVATFTMTNSAVPPCTEQVVRYIQQEPLAACALTTFASQSSILANTATNYQMELDLVNQGSEALNLTGISFTWTAPNRVLWNSVKFPSTATATVTGPGNVSGDYVVDLDPKPGQMTISDITVPANGTRSVLLNMAACTGGGCGGGPAAQPSDVVPSIISNICVQYTLTSQPGFTFSCKIKPDSAAANPGACQ
jgi:type II secretory pathway pseudopilin PulG